MPEYGEKVSRSSDTCYRHPDRQSFILCQRCGRTICAECQTPAPVGVHCPECMKEARASQPRVRRVSSGQPVVTYTLVGINVALYLLQQFIPGFTQALWFAPAYVQAVGYFEPWRMLTSMFLHGSLWHILFNMYALYVFGSMLERGLGRGRYLALYLISGFAGSVAVLLLGDPFTPVVGASGAIFGLFGAFIVLQKQMGGSIRGLLILLAINVVIAFLPGSNIAWQAHLGGILVGGLLGFILGRTRREDQQGRQKLLFGAIAAALVVITVAAGVLV